MARVTLATLKRLDAVERGMFGDEGASRVGVMRVPRILGLDEWQAIAMTTLAALAASAREDIDRCTPRTPFVEPLPQALNEQIEGVHFHRPDPHRNQAPVSKRPPSAPMIR